MTICLWTGDTLFTDSLVSGGFRLFSHKYKIIDQDTLLFGSGDFNNTHLIYNLYTTFNDEPALKCEPNLEKGDDYGFTVIIVRRVNNNFKIYIMKNSPQAIEIPNQLIAIGCGCEYALGAYEAGATALKAVEIACKLDSPCDGPVVEVKWDNDKGFHITNECKLPLSLI